MTFKGVWLTVAGPMMATPFSLAFLIISLVLFSGIPSAMMAMVRNYMYTYKATQTSDGILELISTHLSPSPSLPPSLSPFLSLSLSPLPVSLPPSLSLSLSAYLSPSLPSSLHLAKGHSFHGGIKR